MYFVPDKAQRNAALFKVEGSTSPIIYRLTAGGWTLYPEAIKYLMGGEGYDEVSREDAQDLARQFFPGVDPSSI